MRQLTLIILLFSSLTRMSFGQTIHEIFKSLPLEYTPELTTEAKDSLIENGTYSISGGDSLETMKTDYSAQKGYIRLSYYFTTGQSGFIVIELKKFQKTDGSLVVIYSKFGGARRAFDQHSLLTFDYENGILKHNKKLGLPETIETREFLKENLPDSLETKEIMLSSSFDLEPNEINSVVYVINPQTDQFDNWIKTDNILYTWNGEKFEKRKK